MPSRLPPAVAGLRAAPRRVLREPGAVSGRSDLRLLAPDWLQAGAHQRPLPVERRPITGRRARCRRLHGMNLFQPSRTQTDQNCVKTNKTLLTVGHTISLKF